MIRYIRSTILPSKPAQLLIQTGLKWNQDNCSGMAAALSYYALFSLFPILLVILSVIGSLIEPNTEAFQYIKEVVQRYLPPEVHDLVKATVTTLNQNSTGAGIIGFGLLLSSGSTVFAVLRSAVNKIWRSNTPGSESESIRRTVLSFVLNQLLAFLLVLGTALLLLTSLISNIAIKTILNLVATFRETFSFIQVDELLLSKGLQVGSSFLILALAVCILFKILPSVYVGWRDVWLGALLTALLLMGLQQLVSNSIITIGSHFLSYGVIGSVMILLLWIYLTCEIFFVGCEFSYVYTHLFGSRRCRTVNHSHSLEQ
ncbi:YihY/virulence factor BrkB family protein [Fischerella sp. PCC 9605]|uniref:YihY/virulence factor BrkB family protein n=1 Tax=Fischerella sp. PCC 9605 TaxID=1173024 RepID=UPI00047B0583|nr:YihY/virulence factor BrkB family protein [Fischerella sp. PCC 9605]